MARFKSTPFGPGRKAGSESSSGANTSQTSTHLPPSASKWHTSRLGGVTEARVEMDAQNKKNIQRSLNLDREAIRGARTARAKKANFDLLDTSEQERQLEEAAMLKVQHRIGEGLYVSCKYPEFEGYVSPFAYGETGHIKDPVRNKCLSRQLEALRAENTGEHLTSDDEDVPRFKAEENVSKQKKVSDFLQFVNKDEARLSKDRIEHGRTTGAGEGNSDKTTSGSRRSQGWHKVAHASKHKRVEKDNKSKKEVITWRAVNRGMPRLPDSPVPKLKQPGLTRNPWYGRVVSRGQVLVKSGGNDD